MKRVTELLDPSLLWMTGGVLVFIGGMLIGALTQSYFPLFLFLVIGGLMCAVGVRRRGEWAKRRDASAPHAGPAKTDR